MKIQLAYRGQSVMLEIDRDDQAITVKLPDGSERAVSADIISDRILEVRVDNRTLRMPYLRTNAGIQFSYQGRVYEFTSQSRERASGDGRDHSGELIAPMTGTIADVLVSDGELVSAYQPLVVIEAMKVLATVEAPFAGIVSSLDVAKGQRVDQGVFIARITPGSPNA